MGEIMTTLNSVASIDQGNIAGQAYNINTKNTRSKQRNEQSSKSELEITNHAAGIASDLKLLNKLHQSLNTTANILINRKSQRTSTIDTTTKTKIQSLIIKQV
jgi:MinD superfamily P-loop ATPase